jgi:DNA-binding MarR family transcriptional regulator
MAVSRGTVPNREYDPSDLEADILAVLKEGRNEDEPWGYANPKRLVNRTDVRRQYVQRALDNLVAAGWIEKPDRGLYRFVEDPRDD